MHIKKSEMPTTWPIARKPNKKRFIAVPSHARSKGITILYILRDVLKIAATRTEAKRILLNGDVKINGVARKDEKFTVQVFDKVSLEKVKKYYRLNILNRKFSLEEVSKEMADEKVAKVIGKVVIDSKHIQMNLEDGTNFITKEKFNVGDSALVNFKSKKIDRILPLKKDANVEIISGKHAGEKGKLISFEELVRGKNYKVKLEDGHEVTLPLKTFFVVR